MLMKKIIQLFLCTFTIINVHGQSSKDSVQFSILVLNEKSIALESASVEMINVKMNTTEKADLTDQSGSVVFLINKAGKYLFRITYAGYRQQTTDPFEFPLSDKLLLKQTIVLQPAGSTLAGVKVVATKPFIQRLQGKVILNAEASVTNTGTTVLELLEKAPGIMVDKNGTINMQAKNGVLVLIDDNQLTCQMQILQACWEA